MEFSHQELTLMTFALEGGAQPHAGHSRDSPSCEESCPVVESLEESLGVATLSPDKQLLRHLNNHVREGLIESGLFELMANQLEPNGHSVTPAVHEASFRDAQERLIGWRCEMKLSDSDRRLLLSAISHLPWSAWISMPRTLWRLRRKLK
jgi:hypothetical protein